jgi:acyl dehydratase
MTSIGAEARMAEAVITEELIDSMRSLAGTALRIDHSINNEEATRLAILKFADGIGDTNPLWRDAAHATSSAYGAPVAPPSWVNAVFAGMQFGWPGLGAFHSSTATTFAAPIMRGDAITPTCTYEGFDGPKPSRFAGQMVEDRFTLTYDNQIGQRVATSTMKVIKYERAQARSAGKESTLELPHPWTPEEVEAIEAEVLSERPRGAEPRWWDEVQVGDDVGPLLKGPIGMTDEIAFVAAGGAPIPRLAAHRAALELYAKHPAWSFRDPDTSALEPIYAVHYNHHAARAMGVPMAYDVGAQRQCWHVHLLTDWMGDDAWIKQAYAEFRGFVYHSDLVRLRGTVTGRYIDDDGDTVVDIETTAVNQRGVDVMPGRATIALPSRSGSDTPVGRRMAERAAARDA